MPLYSPTTPAGTDGPSRASIFAAIRAHSQIISVASAAARTSLLTTLAGLAPAVTPAAATPVWVYRQDTGAIEACVDPTGAAWSTWLPYADTGWLALPLAGSSWTAVSGYTPEYRRIGNTVYLRGMVTFAAGQYTDTIATMPVGYRPATNTWLPPAMTAASGKVIVQMLVQPTGTIAIPAGYFSTAPAAGNQFSIAGTYAIG